jgi:protein phosphatase 1 regulatory subunit 3A/B/C/D/E
MSSSCQKQHINREYSLHLSKNFRFPTNLLQQVYQQQVVLERIFIRGITAYGTIRVNNCSFHKRIFVKYTQDQWKTFSTLNAYYTMHDSDTNTDSFQFKLTSTMKVSFVICYCANGYEFWDNNYSQNYTLER